MSRLQLKLFGDFRARLDETDITEFESNRARALFAYVALHADRPHRRDALATLLWDVDAGDRGLTNLRSTLRRVQNALQPNDRSTPFLRVNRNSVQFEVASLNNRYGSPGQESLEIKATEAQIDVLAFEQLWADIDAHGHQRIDSCAYCMERLRRAAALYHGPLLAYLYVDSVPFETWLHGERERLHRSAMRALHLLADYYMQRREFTPAERYARRQIELEVWNEEAHVQLINILYLSGARSTAVAQYRACCVALSQELDVEPQPETAALFAAIAASTPPEQARHLLSDAANSALDYEPPLHNLPLAEQALIGRAQDRDQLLYHLGIPRNRLVTLVGPGGIGKSRLALDVAHALVGFFAGGAWLVELGAIDSAGTEDETEQAIAAQIVETINAPRSEGLPKERLLAHLRAQKALLVLDNFDRLTAGAGLIQALLQAAPKVCVIVTSRQQLDLRSAHVMALSGLAVPSHVGSKKVQPRLCITCCDTQQSSSLWPPSSASGQPLR
ncbi:MAG: BTAD domain-containing putative transcriptional regulator [Caldilineaceae bacterium]